MRLSATCTMLSILASAEEDIFRISGMVHLVGLGMLILMKIVVFVIGFFTIRMGYKLISAGAKGEFKFASTWGPFKSDL
jgi:hypothetical protein